MQPDFWKGRRVLVTGHTGFKGSWACIWLRHLGAIVDGFALAPPTKPSLFDVARVGQGMQSTVGDIRDLGLLEAVIGRARPEIILHLAAQPLVLRSYDDPIETYSTNVMGTLNVLQAARSAMGLKAIVVITSDKCYDNREWPWGYREQDPMGGFDPYSSSKGCAELLTASMRRSFFCPAKHATHGVAVASARAGNVIGGGDWASDRLVPDILRALLDGRAPEIRRPDAVRPWQHVLDPLAGYLMLAQRLVAEGPEFGEGWNFGPEDSGAWPVRLVADRLVGSWGMGASWHRCGPDGPHEAQWLKLDASKARQRLGWRPRWDTGTAIDKTVSWTKAFAQGEDMSRASLRQIEEYMACT